MPKLRKHAHRPWREEKIDYMGHVLDCRKGTVLIKNKRGKVLDRATTKSAARKLVRSMHGLKPLPDRRMQKDIAPGPEPKPPQLF